MSKVLRIIGWEIFWKNRFIFPVLGLLLLAGAGVAWGSSHASPGAAWVDRARSITVMGFLCSLLLCVAPFTMMESSGGWKMNSMLTRWFTLPVSTSLLVLFPILTGALCTAALVYVWVPVLDRVAPGLDALYVVAIFAAAILLIHFFAWLLPRRPVQYWTAVGLLFPVVLLLAFGPQNSRNEYFRRGLLIPLALFTVPLLGLTLWVATRTRCGSWAGELPAVRLPRFLLKRNSDSAALSSWTGAVFATESLPFLRSLALSWFALLLGMFFYSSLEMRGSFRKDLAFSPKLLPVLATSVYPGSALIWSAVWGLVGGGEPGSVFRSRVTSFRATLPISCGVMAGNRMAMLAGGWLLVWAPVLIAAHFSDASFFGMPDETMEHMLSLIARFVVWSASLVAGALPIVLLGRCEGFPNILLAGLLSWGGTIVLATNLPLQDGGASAQLWTLGWVLLVVKFTAAATGFILGIRRGCIAWRFVISLLASWGGVLAFLVWVMPVWRTAGGWGLLSFAIMIPLARFAWCPVALAANRHR